MAKLGTRKKPAVVRVKSQERAKEIVELCTANDWQVMVGVEPDQPEDISDVETLQAKRDEKPVRPVYSSNRSPNDYCACGSEKKYKNCCMGKTDAAKAAGTVSQGGQGTSDEKTAGSPDPEKSKTGKLKRWFQSLK